MQMFLWWVCFGAVYATADVPACCPTGIPAVVSIRLSADTVDPHGKRMKRMLDKFAVDSFRSKKKKSNKNYNDVFARIIWRLDTCRDRFNFIYDSRPMGNGEKVAGSFDYKNNEFYITIRDPGAQFGTDNGREGILFEEVKHAEQMINGETLFMFPKDSTHWSSTNSAELELCTKLFVIAHFEIHKDWYPPQGKIVSAPTELGYLACYLQTDAARKKYLMEGEKYYPVMTRDSGRSAISIESIYPGLKDIPIVNDHYKGIKNDTIYAYPPLPRAPYVYQNKKCKE